MGQFDRIPSPRRSGSEPFCSDGEHLGFELLSFWQWSSSDVLSNATRGVLAEYLVARAIGASDGVREEWASYDLRSPQGTTIEVKSAAYIQSWHQKQLSSISFRCGKTLAWDPETNQMGGERRRHAQVYVFALLVHKDKATVDPLDVSQWQFYVLPTFKLDERTRSQHSVTLTSLRGELRIDPVGFFDLKEAIDAATNSQRLWENREGPR